MIENGINETELSKILIILEKHNTIYNSHNFYVITTRKENTPNTYITYSYDDFCKDGIRKVEARKVLDYELYDTTVGKYIAEMKRGGIRN